MLLELDINTSLITGMKKGRMPAADTMANIANYLGVSTDYLLGNWKSKVDAVQTAAMAFGFSTLQDDAIPTSDIMTLTDDEQKLLEDYRSISNQGKEYISQTMLMATMTYKKHDIFDDAEFSKELG